REDYHLELAELYQQALTAGLWSGSPQEAEPVVEAAVVASGEDSSVLMPVAWQLPADTEAANEEITELRRKLQRLGSVNLDSLRELADLELRAATLNAQFNDLASAKHSL